MVNNKKEFNDNKNYIKETVLDKINLYNNATKVLLYKCNLNFEKGLYKGEKYKIYKYKNTLIAIPDNLDISKDFSGVIIYKEQKDKIDLTKISKENNEIIIEKNISKINNESTNSYKSTMICTDNNTLKTIINNFGFNIASFLDEEKYLYLLQKCPTHYNVKGISSKDNKTYYEEVQGDNILNVYNQFGKSVKEIENQDICSFEILDNMSKVKQRTK